ncbi:MAG TPA: hypothetical protein [Caudoviricetes sp.]|nr:MAG TPA: hypothetical protein [Caudoviricetes sp.]
MPHLKPHFLLVLLVLLFEPPKPTTFHQGWRHFYSFSLLLPMPLSIVSLIEQ